MRSFWKNKKTNKQKQIPWNRLPAWPLIDLFFSPLCMMTSRVRFVVFIPNAANVSVTQKCRTTTPDDTVVTCSTFSNIIEVWKYRQYTKTCSNAARNYFKGMSSNWQPTFRREPWRQRSYCPRIIQRRYVKLLQTLLDFRKPARLTELESMGK